MQQGVIQVKEYKNSIIQNIKQLRKCIEDKTPTLKKDTRNIFLGQIDLLQKQVEQQLQPVEDQLFASNQMLMDKLKNTHQNIEERTGRWCNRGVYRMKRSRKSRVKRSRKSRVKRSRKSRVKRSRKKSPRKSIKKRSVRKSRKFIGVYSAKLSLSLETIQHLFDSEDVFFVDMLNIWIVYHGGRTACLIETTNYRTSFETYWPTLQTFVKDLGMTVTRDPNGHPDYPRYLISKQAVEPNFNEQQLGKMLGFSYLKSDYGDGAVQRVYPEISAQTKNKSIQLWVEVSRNSKQASENATALVQKWTDILRQFPFPYDQSGIRLSLEIKTDDGWNIRSKQIHNKDYFLSHYSDYVNDVDNFIEPGKEEWISIMNAKPTNNSEIEKRKHIWLQVMTAELGRHTNT